MSYIYVFHEDKILYPLSSSSSTVLFHNSAASSGLTNLALLGTQSL